MRKPFFYLILVACLISLKTTEQTNIQGLLAQGLVTPQGVDDAVPAFAWQMSSPKRGVTQSAEP